MHKLSLKKYKIFLQKNLQNIKIMLNFAALLKRNRGVAQLVRVRVWGA